MGRSRSHPPGMLGTMTPDPTLLLARALGGSPGAVRELATAWDGGAAVPTVLAAFVQRAVDAALGLGWTRTEVVRLVGSPREAPTRLVGAVVSDDRGVAEAVERWRAGCSSTLEAVAAAVHALTALGSLPAAPGGAGAGAGPGSGAAGGDDAVLAKVRALLAKAESTSFPAEAEALSAKAHELMARHAIDRAVLAGGAGAGEVGCRRIWIDDPYASAKRLLLAQVAGASGCRTVWTKGLQLVTVFGLSEDLDAVEVLHTSLLVQATAAMLAAGGRAGDRTRSRGFRSSFLHAYAGRIGERLREAQHAAVEEASAAHGASVLPVLASKEAAVDEAMRAAFPHLRQARAPRVADAAGWHAGRAAGSSADLGQERVRAGAVRALRRA